MLKIYAERVSDGKTIRITQNEEFYQLVEAEGFETPSAKISSYEVASLDGVRVNHIRMQQRDLTLSIFVSAENTEYYRQQLLDLFRVKGVIRLYIYTEYREVYIDCYVEKISIDYFSNKEIVDIDLVCPTPYFSDLEVSEADASQSQKLFQFPMQIQKGMPIEFSVIDFTRTATINVDSENETGCLINLIFGAGCSQIIVQNSSTGEFFRLDYDFREGDIVTIDTISGEKSVSLLRSTNTTNLIPYVFDGSTWFQLNAGENTFVYYIDGGSTEGIDMTVTYRRIFYAI